MLFEEHTAPEVNLAFNINPMLDHQTGQWVEGTRGEMILVGGLTPNVGILAKANCGKSELLLAMYATATTRYPSSTSYIQDTEGTLPKDRIVNSTLRYGDVNIFKGSKDHHFIGNSLPLDDWYNKLNTEKSGRFKKLKEGKGTITCPFYYSNLYEDKMLPPMFLGMDSFSEANGKDNQDKLEKEGVADKSNQTYDMIQGNLKTRIMNGVAQFGPLANMYLMTTASLDTFVDVNSAPGRGPAKHAAYLAATEKPKGVGTKYKKCTSGIWTFGIPKPLWKGTAKADQVPKYPYDESELYPGNKMYEYTEVLNVRGKSGASGLITPLVKQQGFGLREDLSMLMFIREWGDKITLKDGVSLKDYGMSSPKQYTFSFDLAPDVHWRNTTLQKAIEDNPKLIRVLEILYGMKYEFYVTHNPKFLDYYCTPAELYQDLTDMGYDWDTLLDTRGWWTHTENEKKFKPFLSTLDLLRMRKGEYVPFWFNKEQRAKIKKV